MADGSTFRETPPRKPVRRGPNSTGSSPKNTEGFTPSTEELSLIKRGEEVQNALREEVARMEAEGIDASEAKAALQALSMYNAGYPKEMGRKGVTQQQRADRNAEFERRIEAAEPYIAVPSPESAPDTLVDSTQADQVELDAGTVLDTSPDMGIVVGADSESGDTKKEDREMKKEKLREVLLQFKNLSPEKNAELDARRARLAAGLARTRGSAAGEAVLEKHAQQGYLTSAAFYEKSLPVREATLQAEAAYFEALETDTKKQKTVGRLFRNIFREEKVTTGLSAEILALRKNWEDARNNEIRFFRDEVDRRYGERSRYTQRKEDVLERYDRRYGRQIVREAKFAALTAERNRKMEAFSERERTGPERLIDRLQKLPPRVRIAGAYAFYAGVTGAGIALGGAPLMGAIGLLLGAAKARLAFEAAVSQGADREKFLKWGKRLSFMGIIARGIEKGVEGVGGRFAAGATDTITTAQASQESAGLLQTDEELDEIAEDLETAINTRATTEKITNVVKRVAVTGGSLAGGMALGGMLRGLEADMLDQFGGGEAHAATTSQTAQPAANAAPAVSETATPTISGSESSNTLRDGGGEDMLTREAPTSPADLAEKAAITESGEGADSLFNSIQKEIRAEYDGKDMPPGILHILEKSPNELSRALGFAEGDLSARMQLDEAMFTDSNGNLWYQRVGEDIPRLLIHNDPSAPDGFVLHKQEDLIDTPTVSAAKPADPEVAEKTAPESTNPPEKLMTAPTDAKVHTEPELSPQPTVPPEASEDPVPPTSYTPAPTLGNFSTQMDEPPSVAPEVPPIDTSSVGPAGATDGRTGTLSDFQENPLPTAQPEAALPRAKDLGAGLVEAPVVDHLSEYTARSYTNEHDTSIDGTEAHVYKDGKGGLYVHGGSSYEALEKTAIAEGTKLAIQQRGAVTVMFEGEPRMINGTLQRWTDFVVVYHDKPPIDGDPIEKLIGRVPNPDSFTSRIS